MVIGFDFDNTIVRYCDAIDLLARKYLSLPQSLTLDKISIRNYLRECGREDEWTRFQGELYGPGMIYASPFENAVDIAHELLAKNHDLYVVSHRSRTPYGGQDYDLHYFARSWIEKWMPEVFSDTLFLETKDEKLAHVGVLGCDIFIDDLPEILSDTSFPSEARGVLFAPNNEHCSWAGDRLISWEQITSLVEADGRYPN